MSVMQRITLHVPERRNDGSAVDERQLASYEAALLDLAPEITGSSGYTLTRGTGVWRSPTGRTYREPVRLYAIDVDDVDTVIDAARGLARLIAEELQQEGVYLTVSSIYAEAVSEYVSA